MSSIELVTRCASDLAVVNAARVSLGRFKETYDLDDRRLLRWLMRDEHGSPFEHGYFQFRVVAPVFVQRDWMRHRAGHSFNELSTRYAEMKDECYMPATFRTQIGKPGAYKYEDIKETPWTRWYRHRINASYRKAFKTYYYLLQQGVAREQAMTVLPMGMHTQFVWSCNPRSLMHFLSLRNDKDARKEIRDLAANAESYLKLYMPDTHAAFLAAGRTAP